MIEVLVLDELDIIEPTDLVRSCYAATSYDARATKWMEARLALPYWVGKRLRDYYNFDAKGYPQRQRRCQVMRVPPEVREKLGFIVTDRKEISLFP